MTLKIDWVNWCVDLACSTQNVFWSGARLISDNKEFVTRSLDESLTLQDVGYTEYKLTRLHDQYFVQDSVDVAMMLHARNVARKKYASAAFHCYGHLLKNDVEKKSKRASVMGPCLQSVILTLRPHERRTRVTVYYRTTEAFKKLPADFVWLRDRVAPLIPGQDKFPVTEWRFHFANVTTHPMYAVTILPHLPDPIATLELWKDRNHAFWEWSGKWMARYLIGGAAGRSIEKFAQAQRTSMAANELVSSSPGLRRRIITYLHHNRDSFMPKNTRFDKGELESAFNDAMKGLD